MNSKPETSATKFYDTCICSISGCNWMWSIHVALNAYIHPGRPSSFFLLFLSLPLVPFPGPPCPFICSNPPRDCDSPVPRHRAQPAHGGFRRVFSVTLLAHCEPSTAASACCVDTTKYCIFSEKCDTPAGGSGVWCPSSIGGQECFCYWCTQGWQLTWPFLALSLTPSSWEPAMSAFLGSEVKKVESRLLKPPSLSAL